MTGVDPHWFRCMADSARDVTIPLGIRIANHDELVAVRRRLDPAEAEAVGDLGRRLAEELAAAGEARTWGVVYSPGPGGTILRSLPS